MTNNEKLKMEFEDVTIDESKDLPLLANAEEIRARHYMFRLECRLQEKFFEVEAIVFLSPIHHHGKVLNLQTFCIINKEWQLWKRLFLCYSCSKS